MTFSVFKDLVNNTAEQRRTFFKLVFGEKARGWVCISYLDHTNKKMSKAFFEWPNDLEKMLENITHNSQRLVHAYFCPNLYSAPGDKHKEYVGTCTNIWSDLDTCPPSQLLVRPSILIESSPNKYQALWLLEDELAPLHAEDISRKIAYYHADQGADRSGWDLSQLLRIPYTPNYKYGDMKSAPIVSIVHGERTLFRPSDFDCYPFVEAIRKIQNAGEIPRSENADEIVERYDLINNWRFGDLYNNRPKPDEDWSVRLWNLLKICQESQVPIEDTFSIAKAAACNKYARDGRTDEELWSEVNRAYFKRVEHLKLVPTVTSTIPDLLSKEEINAVLARETFVERYIKWAKTITDASIQYHQSGAFMILSALLAGNVNLDTSFGTIIPNLWFMILGNTTITRKTTAMNIATNLLFEVDDRALLATDGSLEGILVGMRDRPGQPSIFLRDEFSGLLEAIAHKDYMAGFAEQLTKLYDGQPLRRLLRKETIDIKDPIFIMYVGGIKAKTQMLMTEELVMGGFMPRFIMITAEPDISNIRPMGPPLAHKGDEREIIKNELIDMHNHYVQPTMIKRGDTNLGRATQEFKAYLTPAAWLRYNTFERDMTKTALDTGLDYLTPVYDRLSKSVLKAAILIAASTKRTTNVIVEELDICHAIFYGRQWREYASEIVNGVGKSYDERLMDKIVMAVRSSPIGVSRQELMKKFQLDAKRAGLLFATLEQRGEMTQVTLDGGERRYKTLD